VTRPEKFKLGGWLVEPSLDRISRGEQKISLQPQVMDLLLYLARHSREVVSTGDLLENLWPDRVVTMASIYSSLKQLRDALGDDARHPTYIQTIPKRGYRLIAAVEDQVEPLSASEMAPATTWRWRAVLITLAAIFVLAIAWRSDGPAPAETAANPGVQPSLAVLPFSASEAGQGWFAEGIAAEILDELGQAPGLRVAGRTSSFSFRDSQLDPREIGQALGVNHLIQGYLRHDEENAQIKVGLIKTDDGSLVWSQEYDRKLPDTVGLPREVTVAVVSALGLVTQPGDSPVPAVMLPIYTSYERYLQARSLMEAGTKASLMGALDMLDKALQLDPGFARAHVAMADVYLQLRQYNGYYQNSWLREARELALPHLQQAIHLDPNLGEAHAVLGDALMGLDSEGMVTAYQHAIVLNPNLARAHLELAVALNDRLVSWQEINDQLEFALRIEPLSILAASVLVQFSTYVPHRWDETERIMRRLKQFYPDHPEVQWLNANWLMESNGGYAAAIPLLEHVLQTDPDHAWARNKLAIAWIALGEFERAQEIKDLGTHWSSVLEPDREAALSALENSPPWADHELDSQRRMLDAYAHAMLRDWQGAIDLLAEDSQDEEAFIGLFAQNLAKTVSPATTLAVAYRALGDTAKSREWAGLERRALDARSENGRLHNFEYSRVMARLHALEGRPYQSLLELERLVTNGPIDPRDLMHPAFDDMRSTPGFVTLEQIQRQRVNAERSKLDLPTLP